MDQSKVPMSIACTVQVQQGSRAVVIPAIVHKDTTLTVMRTYEKSSSPTNAIEVRGEGVGHPISLALVLLTFADCHWLA